MELYYEAGFLVFLFILSWLKGITLTFIETGVNINTILVTKPKIYKDNTLFLFYTIGWTRGFDFNRCYKEFDVGTYKLTTNRNDIDKADIVIFHHFECDFNFLRNKLYHRPNQSWVWFSMEPPKNINHNIGQTGYIFNLTASFRTDSDIYLPYGHFIDMPSNYTFKTQFHTSFEFKTKYCAWFISRWEDNSLRVKYYHELKKYIPIDKFGGKVRQHDPVDQCDVIKHYKFYLSFENSNVTDYITEKLWYNAFYCGSIPVVLGNVKAAYLKVLPPGSFIHVDDFESPKELAKFLIELAKDKKRYNSYFNWRKGRDVYFRDNLSHYFCRAMAQVRKAQPKPRIIENIEKWFKS